jgi:antirestriction protein ArdC
VGGGEVGLLRELTAVREGGIRIYLANHKIDPPFTPDSLWKPETNPKPYPSSNRFTVFNTDQCEDLPADLAPAPEPIPHDLVLPQAEALIRATGADLRIGGNRAFYVPSEDYIQVRRPRHFSSRSTGTGQFFMSLVITVVIAPG